VIKLVGGTDRFVQRPLLYAGFWYGLLGGAVAVVLVAIVGAFLSFPLQWILLSYQSSVENMPGLSFSVFIKLLVLGALLGCGGAWLSVLQNLRSVEPR
jgi:cell division transport system permease protein